MRAGRSFDGPVAAVMLAAALLCLRAASLAGAALFAPSDADAPEALLSGDVGAAIRLAVFLGFAGALGLGGWRRLSAARRTLPAPAAAPLFGRAAGPRPAASAKRSPVLGAVLVVAIGALVLDFAVPLRPNPPAAPADAPPLEAADPPAAEEPAAPALAETEPSAPQDEPAIAAETEPPADGAAEAPGPPQDADEPPPVTAEAPPPAQAAEAPPAAEEAAPPAPAPAPAAPVEAAEPPQTVAVLPVPVLPPTRPDGHAESVVWLAVSPDGRLLLSAGIDRAIKLWDLAEKRLARDLGAHKDMARTALFMPDGIHALTAGDDGEIVLRRLDDGTVAHVFSAAAFGAANQIAISRDGTVAISGHRGGGVVVWDVSGRKVRHVLPSHSWPVVSVALSPDGTRAVSGSIEGVLKLWDIETGRQIREWRGHERGTYAAAFLADGRRFVTGSGDYTIKLWDAGTGEELRRFTGHSGTVYTLALSADESRLLSGSLDGTARIWDVGTGRELAQFAAHAGPIYAVAFMADGSALTGAYSGAIRRWPADGGDAAILFPAAGK